MADKPRGDFDMPGMPSGVLFSPGLQVRRVDGSSWGWCRGIEVAKRVYALNVKELLKRYGHLSNDPYVLQVLYDIPAWPFEASSRIVTAMWPSIVSSGGRRVVAVYENGDADSRSVRPKDLWFPAGWANDVVRAYDAGVYQVWYKKGERSFEDSGHSEIQFVL